MVCVSPCPAARQCPSNLRVAGRISQPSFEQGVVEPPGATPGLYVALEALRADVREDMDKMEHRVTGAIDGIRREISEYGKAHGEEHATTRAATAAIHERFDAFIKANELAQARRDGALGMLRFALDLGTRNWKFIVILFGAVGLALGNVRLNIGLT